MSVLVKPQLDCYMTSMDKKSDNLTAEIASAAGNEAAGDEIAQHHATGVPVYGMQEGKIVRFFADGTTSAVTMEELEGAATACQSSEPGQLDVETLDLMKSQLAAFNS